MDIRWADGVVSNADGRRYARPADTSTQWTVTDVQSLQGTVHCPSHPSIQNKEMPTLGGRRKWIVDAPCQMRCTTYCLTTTPPETSFSFSRWFKLECCGEIDQGFWKRNCPWRKFESPRKAQNIIKYIILLKIRFNNKKGDFLETPEINEKHVQLLNKLSICKNMI
jgi:hypothetical protein